MSKKSISINPDFFNFKKKKKDKKQKPSLKKNKLKPNDVKKKLIARIKEHQKKQKEIEEQENKEENTFENDFQSTLSYLEEMKKKKRKQKIKKQKQKTLKNREKLVQPSIEPLQNNIPVDINPMDDTMIKDPPYGCLKGGYKPTWKQYNKTLKNNKKEILDEFQNKPLLNFNLYTNDEFSERKDKLKDLQTKFQGISEVVKPKKYKIKTKRIRRKITLGKNRHKKIVGVLVKSKKTRRIIKNEVNVLKRKSINEVKSYLRKHNLIKIGSNAPDHIFRSIYESAYLSGDIKNKNADVLLHNWNEDEI